MYQGGEIRIAKCEKCFEEFPIFVFVADTDMVTSGCISLAGLDKNIVLTVCGPSETDSEVESRIGNSYRIVKVRFEETVSAKGLSIQDFQKIYEPPTAVYSCIYCGMDAKVVRNETKEEFLQHGKIEIHDDC